MSPGDATTCETTCDGVTTVPNAESTACGELFFRRVSLNAQYFVHYLSTAYFYCITFAVCNAGYFGTGSDSCVVCGGNTAKPKVGDAATCDQVCEPYNSRPNDQWTSCGKYPVSVSTEIKSERQFLVSTENSRGAVQKYKLKKR